MGQVLPTPEQDKPENQDPDVRFMSFDALGFTRSVDEQGNVVEDEDPEPSKPEEDEDSTNTVQAEKDASPAVMAKRKPGRPRKAATEGEFTDADGEEKPHDTGA